MFDMHHDLLTALYMKKYSNQAFNFSYLVNNKGLIANLYFLSKKEMIEEFDYKTFDVLQMFLEAKKELEKLNFQGKVLYSIEGCDFIKNADELEKLCNQGLNSILLVWNNKNKYGSGFKSNKGLTFEGEKFIQKAIDLNLGIDVSHMNRKTFDDVIDLIKKSSKKVVCFASHSNIYTLHNHPRNLTDEQLKALKSVGGMIGIASYADFVSDSKDKQTLKKQYIKHILYAVNVIGIDNVCLATDNMDFSSQLTKNLENKNNIYDYASMGEEVKQELMEYMSEEDADKIIYKNGLSLYNTLVSN